MQRGGSVEVDYVDGGGVEAREEGFEGGRGGREGRWYLLWRGFLGGFEALFRFGRHFVVC